jgi:hypothetical protein
MAKVLDGNYDNAKPVTIRKEEDLSWMKQYMDDTPKKTIKDDPVLAERADRLRRDLGR